MIPSGLSSIKRPDTEAGVDRVVMPTRRGLRGRTVAAAAIAAVLAGGGMQVMMNTVRPEQPHGAGSAPVIEEPNLPDSTHTQLLISEHAQPDRIVTSTTPPSR